MGIDYRRIRFPDPLLRSSKLLYLFWAPAFDCASVFCLDGSALRKRQGCLRWTPHPVIVTIMDNKDYIRVLLYSYYTTITGWGVLLRDVQRVQTWGEGEAWMGDPLFRV